MLLCFHLLSLFMLPSLGAAENWNVVIGTIGSSVFLDPEHKGDLTRSEILWTFTGSNKSPVTILDYVPDKPVEEPNEQFRSRLQFNASTGCLLVDRIKPEDQGFYHFYVDGRKSRELLLFLRSKEVIGTIGSSVFLDPEHKGDLTRSEILWTFTGSNENPVTILDYVPDKPVEEPNDQFRSRLQFNTSTGCLLIDRIKPEDQGFYNFYVGERRTTTIELLLFYELSKTLIRSEIAPGYVIQLTCEVDGNPQKYEWLRNGGEISQRHWLINENRSLVILTDSTGECETYTCVASNPVSSAQANYTINFPGISRKDAIIIIPSISGLVFSLVCLGGSLLLWCLEKKLKRASLSLMIFRVLSLAATFVALASWIGIKGANFIPTVALCMVGVRLVATVIPVIRKSSCLFTEEFKEKKERSCHTSIYTWTVPTALIVSCVTVISLFLATYHLPRFEECHDLREVVAAP